MTICTTKKDTGTLRRAVRNEVMVRSSGLIWRIGSGLLVSVLTSTASAVSWPKACEYLWLRFSSSAKTEEFVEPGTSLARRWEVLNSANAQERWVLLDFLSTYAHSSAHLKERDPFILTALPWMYEALRILDYSALTPLKYAYLGSALRLLRTPFPLGRNVYGDLEVDHQVTQLQLSEFRKFLNDQAFFGGLKSEEPKALLLEAIANELIAILRATRVVEPAVLKFETEACRLLCEKAMPLLVEFRETIAPLDEAFKSAQRVLSRIAQSAECTAEMRKMAAEALKTSFK